MKNILLTARSFKLFVVLCTLSLCTLVACDKKDEPTPEQNLYGDVARPAWTAPEDYDYTSSMTAVIRVEKLNDQIVNDQMVNDSDMLAAFSGETCLGIAKKYEDGLFFLYIASPTANSQELTAHVTLRYWSAHYTNLFEAPDAFPFVNDTQQGTPDTPFVPTFVVTK